MDPFNPRTSGAWAYEPRKQKQSPFKVWVWTVAIIAISGLSVALVDRAIGKARHDATASVKLSNLYLEGF